MTKVEQEKKFWDGELAFMEREAPDPKPSLTPKKCHHLNVEDGECVACGAWG